MKQTAVDWLVEELSDVLGPMDTNSIRDLLLMDAINRAKEMEKEQMGYTKEDVLKAGEMGETNHHDTKHIVSYLDEAKQYNETFNTKEK
jgi:hypothetical protein